MIKFLSFLILFLIVNNSVEALSFTSSKELIIELILFIISLFDLVFFVKSNRLG